MALAPAALVRAVGLVVLLGLGLLIVARGLTPAAGGVLVFMHLIDLVSVSYTHLTLPTILLV